MTVGAHARCDLALILRTAGPESENQHHKVIEAEAPRGAVHPRQVIVAPLAVGFAGDSPWYIAARALTDQEFVAAAEVLDSMGAEADDQLRRALSFFRSVDATRFIREAEALLASPI
jgi:hypothetical protein